MKIKKDDTVLILSGKDKGKKGKVLRVLPKEDKIVVENINIIKKHTKPRKSGEKGQIVQIPSAMFASKVMIVCSKCGKITRVGSKIIENKKYRICKKCNQEI